MCSASVPPEFVSPVPATIDMTAGDNRNLNLSAYANPAAVTYTLFREGMQLSLPGDIPRFRLNNQGILRISRINKADRGNFTIKAENSQGSATYNFSINVRCELRWGFRFGFSRKLLR